MSHPTSVFAPGPTFQAGPFTDTSFKTSHTLRFGYTEPKRRLGAQGPANGRALASFVPARPESPPPLPTSSWIDVQSPLTHALGLPIAAQAMPDIEGTGGFFMTKGGESKKLLLVMSSSQQTRGQKTRLNTHPGASLASMSSSSAIGALSAFYQDIEQTGTHVLGHVVLSPPISLGTGTQGYTEDYAIIEVDNDKIDRSTFQGNTIDLGTEIPRWEFTGKMPNTTFEDPMDRLLKLRGTMKSSCLPPEGAAKLSCRGGTCLER
ncbi:hypothetical protein IW261DRAFT_1612751 [Armillaria novae-zelandiae]|uniref:Uncharacterized protein n=1 Tax=Armillaria novae-zelandiae TaxID=153914 RepID=A0AA39TSE1_9AGAR|nr:hypothetical protein IW261DRAFT_1612751 [Armillaria novae-zelandiae]